MKITRIDRHEFEIYLDRGELGILRAALATHVSMLHKKAAHCTACGMEAVSARFLLEEIKKTIREYEQWAKEKP